jgi:hypothetical protein
MDRFHTMWRAAAQLAVVAGIALSASGGAQAVTRCTPTAQAGVERCVTGLPATALAPMYQQQEASNWCWAAAVAMVLRRHGLEVPQQQVALSHDGQASDVAISGAAISRVLSRTWKDTQGREVEVAALPVPAWRRSFGLLAPEILRDLEEDKPLILGAREHAVVLVQLVYDRTPRGATQLVRAVVLDPARGAGIRSLDGAELQPEYMARVAVEGGESVAARRAAATTLAWNTRAADAPLAR